MLVIRVGLLSTKEKVEYADEQERSNSNVL
jgi:hypothetical protein